MSTYDDLLKRALELKKFSNELLGQYEKLKSFNDANTWDSDTRALIGLFEKAKLDLIAFKNSEIQNLKFIKTSRESKPFLSKVFSSRSEENIHQDRINDMDKAIINIDTSIGHLFDLIDSTPNTQNEKKEMLKEFRLRKQELLLDKKEINESVRKINVESRQKMTTVTGVRDGFMGDVARYRRIQIRYEKDAKLRPNEDLKAGINRQLFALEKKIIWINQFIGEDPIEINDVLRCAYCGRRIEKGMPCRGCGSV